MIRRLLRLLVRLGVLAALGYGVLRVVQSRRDALGPPAAEPTWPPVTPPRPEPAGWVEPADGACPASHPIKGKLSSKIFHLPGMMAYDRCKADRCYATEDAATADGLRKAKR